MNDPFVSLPVGSRRRYEEMFARGRGQCYNVFLPKIVEEHRVMYTKVKRG